MYNNILQKSFFNFKNLAKYLKFRRQLKIYYRINLVNKANKVTEQHYMNFWYTSKNIKEKEIHDFNIKNNLSNVMKYKQRIQVKFKGISLS